MTARVFPVLLTVPLLALALAACAPAPAPTGAGVTTPSATPLPRPTAAIDVPVVPSAPEAPRAAVPPVRVQVPQVGVDMEVVPVGVESGGFMELPVDPAVAGWYRFGPDPSSPAGNTVVSAHVDAPGYDIGPFSRLRDLGQGSEVIVRSADGTESRYTVNSVTYYAKQQLPTQEIFGRAGPKALVLITCGGEFDQTTGHYADNVVVVASPAA